jgi:hypothetical protein
MSDNASSFAAMATQARKKAEGGKGKSLFGI